MTVYWRDVKTDYARPAELLVYMPVHPTNKLYRWYWQVFAVQLIKAEESSIYGLCFVACPSQG